MANIRKKCNRIYQKLLKYEKISANEIKSLLDDMDDLLKTYTTLSNTATTYGAFQSEMDILMNKSLSA